VVGMAVATQRECFGTPACTNDPYPAEYSVTCTPALAAAPFTKYDAVTSANNTWSYTTCTPATPTPASPGANVTVARVIGGDRTLVPVLGLASATPTLFTQSVVCPLIDCLIVPEVKGFSLEFDSEGIY